MKRLHVPRAADSGSSLRVALVGYGLAGAVFHAPLVRATDGLTLAAIVTSNPERQARARADNPGVRVLPRPEALWEAPGEHDLVIIAAPTGVHAALGRSAIEAGLPVVVDKPLATTAAEARELARLAGSRGSLLTVFHNRRWDGDLLTVQRLLSGGELGAVFRFESRFERFRPSPRRNSWREELPAEQGGGILLDLGSHVVDQALHLFGRPRRVFGQVAARRPGAVVDDDVFIALEHPDGVEGQLWASAVAAIPGPRFRVLGLRGAYAKEGLDIQEESLRNGANPREPGWSDEPRDRWGSLTTASGTRTVPTEPGAWADFYPGVVRALREGVPPPAGAASAAEVLEVLEAVHQSSRTRSVVELPPPTPTD